MELYTMTLGSITYAQRARNLLVKQGISSTLVRARSTGCSYALRMDASQKEKALSILREAGIKTEVT